MVYSQVMIYTPSTSYIVTPRGAIREVRIVHRLHV